jgi:hypothetical protein
MRRRERALVERYVEEAVAPAPPLPPVAGTDAVDAFGAQLAAGAARESPAPSARC